jgi:adenylylsulfate kinase
MLINKSNNKYVIWIMGATASGKTTIADTLIKVQRKNNLPYIQYDGDEVRDYFGETIGFAEKDRLRVVSTITALANKALEAGMNVVVSALTANEDARSYIKQHIKNLIVVYLDCNINKCIERDPKGMYKKAISGEIKTLIGYNSEYLAPANPDIIINTETQSLQKCVDDIIREIDNINF